MGRKGEGVPTGPGTTQSPQWPPLCCSLKLVLSRVVSRLQPLASEVLGAHHTVQGGTGLWEGNSQKAKRSPFFPDQENPAKLSDQKEAVSQGQNPYPIYASVNVRSNISGEDFAGARVWGPREQVEAMVGAGVRGRVYRWVPWSSTVGLLHPALDKAKSPALEQGWWGTMGS